MVRTFNLALFAGAWILTLVACTTRGGDGPTTLTGLVSKGPVSGATIEVFALGADGSRGARLGSGTTDGTGRFQVLLQASGSVEVVATGGSYVDEATGDSRAVGARPLRLRLSRIGPGAVAVTPFTEMAAARSEGLPAQGYRIDAAIDAANKQVAAALGLESITAAPDAPTKVSAPGSVAARYALALAGLSRQAKELRVDPLELTRGFADDIRDGGMNGSKAAATIMVDGTALTAAHWTGLAGAMEQFRTENPSSPLATVTPPKVTLPSAIDPPIGVGASDPTLPALKPTVQTLNVGHFDRALVTSNPSFGEQCGLQRAYAPGDTIDVIIARTGSRGVKAMVSYFVGVHEGNSNYPGWVATFKRFQFPQGRGFVVLDSKIEKNHALLCGDSSCADVHPAGGVAYVDVTWAVSDGDGKAFLPTCALRITPQ